MLLASQRSCSLAYLAILFTCLFALLAESTLKTRAKFANCLPCQPIFQDSSETATNVFRLHRRHEHLISQKRNLIYGKDVLDLGSHDGRWALAALKVGARSVVGIEPRPHLVHNARDNAKHFGFADRVHFIIDNAIDGIKKMQGRNFEVVFMFGMFYHVVNHLELLDAISSVAPSFVIIDSVFYSAGGPDSVSIAYWHEPTAVEGAAALEVSSQVYEKVLRSNEALGIQSVWQRALFQMKRNDAIHDALGLPVSDVRFDVELLGEQLVPNTGMPSLAAMKLLAESSLRPCNMTMDSYDDIDANNQEEVVSMSEYILPNQYLNIGMRKTLVLSNFEC